MALLRTKSFSGFVVQCALLMMLTSLVSAGVSGQSIDEYQVKAAFLYNFAKFVEWPSELMENSHEPITICVLGQNPFGKSLANVVNSKTISGHPILIRMIAAIRPGESCHVLFISGSERKRLPAILEAVRTASILTVGEGEGFAGEGGMIGFRLDDGKVRFEINLLAAEQQKLRISSKLLNLAASVKNSKVPQR